jgi:hypothetical protein
VTVWIDAVCIAQLDLQERGQQIAMMNRVYCSAQQVMVWLGPGDPLSDIAMARFSLLYKVVKVCGWLGIARQDDLMQEIRDIIFSRSITFSVANLLSRHHISNYDVLLIGEIFERQYFRRLWCVQEAILPDRNCVRFCCGKMKVSGKYVRSPIQRATFYNAMWAELLEHSSHLGTIRDSVHNCKIKTSPSDLLAMVMMKDVSRLHDKVFAVYSLATRLGWQLKEPDYGLPLSMLYYDTAVSALNASQPEDGLKLLLLVEGRRMAELPSWVPDLSCVVDAVRFTRSWMSSASAGSKSFWKVGDAQRTLTAKGKLMAVVGMCTPGAPVDALAFSKIVGGDDWDHLAFAKTFRSWTLLYDGNGRARNVGIGPTRPPTEQGQN